MSLFSNLSTSSDIGGEEKDSIGGGSKVWESDLYEYTIKLAYAQKSEKGAMGIFLHLEAPNEEILRQTIYITNAKGENFFTNGKGEKNYLPGFNMINALALLTTGKELSAMETETKSVAIYNYEAKAEVPTKVEVLTPLMGQRIFAGVLKVDEEKTVKNEATGVYEGTGERRMTNEIDKFFCGRDGFEKLTSSEVREKATTGNDPEAPFHITWTDKWKDKVRTKDAKTKASGTAGAPGKPASAGAKPAQSLFGN